MLEKCAINRLSDFLYSLLIEVLGWCRLFGYWGYRMLCMLVSVPTSSLQVGLDLVSAPSCPGAVRVRID